MFVLFLINLMLPSLILQLSLLSLNSLVFFSFQVAGGVLYEFTKFVGIKSDQSVKSRFLFFFNLYFH